MVAHDDPPWAEWPVAADPLAAEFLTALDRLEPREVDWICRTCQTTPTNLANVGGVAVQSIEIQITTEEKASHKRSYLVRVAEEEGSENAR